MLNRGSTSVGDRSMVGLATHIQYMYMLIKNSKGICGRYNFRNFLQQFCALININLTEMQKILFSLYPFINMSTCIDIAISNAAQSTYSFRKADCQIPITMITGFLLGILDFRKKIMLKPNWPITF